MALLGDYSLVIIEALEDPSVLTDSDYDFIDSLSEKDPDIILTEKQVNWLKDIEFETRSLTNDALIFIRRPKPYQDGT